MDVTEIQWVAMDWIHLSEERDQWWEFLNTVMNLWVP
jgi:hypothetical protein